MAAPRLTREEINRAKEDVAHGAALPPELSEPFAIVQAMDIAAAEAGLLAMGVSGFAFLTILCTEVATVQAFLSQLTSGTDNPAAEAARLIHTPVGCAATIGTVSALVIAALYGRHSILAFFLAQPGVKPNMPIADGHTALCASVIGGHTACLQTLLAAGADPNLGAVPPLVWAIKFQRPAALEALLADPRTDISVDSEGATVMGYALRKDGVPCLDVLLKDGRFDLCGPASVSDPQMTSIHAVTQSKSVPMLRRVLREARGRVSVDATDGHDSTAILLAIGADWVEGVRVLIEEGGADPLRQLRWEHNYLMIASSVDRPAVLQFLLEETPLGSKGLDAANDNGATPLYFAAFNGRRDCTRILLRHGADPNRVAYGRPILHHAARHPDTSALQILLSDPRLDVDAPCQHGGCTALHYALRFLTASSPPPTLTPADVPTAIKTLLLAGADPRVRDGVGRTPLRAARDAFLPGPQAPAAAASIDLLEAALDEPARLALLHKARRLVNAGYALPAVAAGVRSRHAARRRRLAAAPFCLHGRVAAGAALPVVEIAAVADAEGDGVGAKQPKGQEKKGKGKKWQRRRASQEEERDAAAAAAAADAVTVKERTVAVLGRVLGVVPVEGVQGGEGDGSAVFPRELFAELQAMMGQRWADAWRP